ncbi:MAG: hypothetical protein HY761_00830 [Candidatus Omnitrophica bacterium]|nr:hypothetical protein [Candidatus Omnitrophota bacterium]
MKTQPFMHNKSLFLVSQSGCLLPLLIMFNLFFGWLFLKPAAWFLLEAGFIILFIINSYIFSRRLHSYAQKRNNVVDVEGKVVEDIENN